MFYNALGITLQFILKKKDNTGTDLIIITGTDPMINTRTDNIVNPPNPHPLRDNTSGFLVTFFAKKVTSNNNNYIKTK